MRLDVFIEKKFARSQNFIYYYFVHTYVRIYSKKPYSSVFDGFLYNIKLYFRSNLIQNIQSHIPTY